MSETQKDDALEAFERETAARENIALEWRARLEKERLRRAAEKHGRVNGRPLSGADLIVLERLRQVSKEGYQAEHDDEHGDGTLAVAAACYALAGLEETHRVVYLRNGDETSDDAWPWEPASDKRKKHPLKRRLIIAGALLAAELDRLLRAETATEEMPDSILGNAPTITALHARLMERFPEDPDVQALLDGFLELQQIYFGTQEMIASPSGFQVALQGMGPQMLVGLIAQLFIDSKAPNYIEWTLHHEEQGPITVNVARKRGKTPSEVSFEKQGRLDRIREIVARAPAAIDKAQAAGAGSEAQAHAIHELDACVREIAANAGEALPRPAPHLEPLIGGVDRRGRLVSFLRVVGRELLGMVGMTSGLDIAIHKLTKLVHARIADEETSIIRSERGIIAQAGQPGGRADVPPGP